MAASTVTDPGTAPENHIRGENLHKASTDRTEADLIPNSGAKDLWKISVDTLFVRADDEQAAIAKFLGALGVAFDAKGVSATNAKPSDLD